MIIFCFLTYNDIMPIKYWNNLFNGIDNSKYQVWIHSKFNINPKIYNFPINIIKNKIKTNNKSDISIVKATIQLFKESSENNNKARMFVFCSQNCIPLYDFNFYYELMLNLNKSIISSIDFNSKNRYYDLHQYLKDLINYEEFVKQQPNMILIKEDIELLLKNDFTTYFSNLQCPDEHYFINVLLNIYKKNIIKSQTHFCNFDVSKTQALNFKNVNESFIKNIKNMGFLFMRKVFN